MRQEKRHFHSARLRRAEAQTWNIQSECAPGPGASAGAESLPGRGRAATVGALGAVLSHHGPNSTGARPGASGGRKPGSVREGAGPGPTLGVHGLDLEHSNKEAAAFSSAHTPRPCPSAALDHSLAAQQEFKITGHNFNEYGRRYFEIGNVCSSTGCYGIFQGKPHLSTRPQLCAGSRTVRSLPMRKLQFWAFLS